jgi:hypothetical protein
MESSRKNSQEKESEEVMGILDDLAKGLGFKDRDEDYYERTAKTLGRTQGAGREAQYRQSNVFQNQPQRGGLFAFMGGGNNQGGNAGGNNILPRMFGYRDRADMTDGGGAYASGGLYQGGGAYSALANLGAALTGQDLGERQTYVDQYIDQQKGAGFAEQMKINYPQYYQQLVVDAMRNM